MAPIPLLGPAGAIGFALALPRVSRPISKSRLTAEAFAIGVLTRAGFAATWALSWWIERRW